MRTAFLIRQRSTSLPWGLALMVGLACPSPGHGWHRLAPGPTALTESAARSIRGITIGPIESAQQPGRGYGTEESARLLAALRALGAEWVALTPFGRTWSLSANDIRMDFEAPYGDARRALRAMIRQAHAHGLKVIVVPHLWVETGGWRGELAPSAWGSYLRAYWSFVHGWALDAASARADAFSIGVECTSWSGRFGSYWAALIASLRRVFPGLLTYSANWDEVDNVLFWDLLDFVGINAFFPLADTAGASDRAYEDNARALVTPLRALAKNLAMPVVFMEVGYTSRPDAAVEPWLWPDAMDHVVVDEREQARALGAIADAFLPEPWFGGFFLWRYYSRLDDVSQEAPWGFSPHGKKAETRLADTFRRTAASDPRPPLW